MSCKSSVLVLGLLAAVTQGAFAQTDHETIRVIIKYKQHASLSSLKSQITKATQLLVQDMKPMANGAYSLILNSENGSSITTKDADVTAQVLNDLRKNPNVLYAVKDRIGYFKPVPDPEVNQNLASLLSHDTQWDEFSPPAGIMLESKPGLKDGAWSYTSGQSKEPVVVAVLDTGIALNDSLINSLLKDENGHVWGWNFAGSNDNVLDETTSYHGTHVAGTIAGYGSVMSGMGEHLKILTVKIPDASGMFYESAVINGMYWSVGAEVPGVPNNKYPAKVLNMSFGVDLGPDKELDYCDYALQEAIFYAREKGAVLLAAAGNDNRLEDFNAPAVCDGTLKIASTGPEALRSYFSNYGPSVSFAAPGGDKHYGIAGAILSTVNPGGGYQSSGFDFYQGTSMATPHAAGVAGLIFAASSKPLKAEEVEQILYTTTHDFGKTDDANKSCVGEKPCGHGILNAENAVKAAVSGYDVLFSAPKLDALAAKACGKSGLQPGKNKLKSGDVVWVKHHQACQVKERYQNPRIEQGSDGKIYALYGAVSYQLDQTGYKECHVIGYDGVGCYR